MPFPPLVKGGKAYAALDEVAQRKREEQSSVARPNFHQPRRAPERTSLLRRTKTRLR
jgi:hypothetical protein